jgi:anthranilate phosphoribosyltransferase
MPTVTTMATGRGEEHPFATYVRAVGKGERLGRRLRQDEAAAAMRLILEGSVEPVQLGAFLIVLRYRKETPEELAGFVQAARAATVAGGLPVDLDWPSYADRHRQLPYFLLAALLLAGAGVRVLVHGIAGEGPATTRAALAALGLQPAATTAAAGRDLERHGLAYMPLEGLCPALERLLALRPLLGLRSPANTYARALNPFAAPCQIQGVFHPNYIELHAEAARLLSQPRAAVLKGGGGEAQINPRKPARIAMLRDGAVASESWPVMLAEDDPGWRDEPLDPARLVSLWRGERAAPGPEAAIVATTAVALRLLGRAAGPDAALAAARDLWQGRDRRRYRPAA